jgi:hypothetical protein
MNINAFKTQLLNGGARPNQFRITLGWPAGVGSPGGEHNILVTSAALPASNVNPTIVSYRGREIKFAGERTFDPWTVSIMNDTKLTLRSYFEKWSSLMNEYVNNGGTTAPGGYMADLICEQLDRNDAVIRTYKIQNAFPTTVSEISLAYNANDTISEFNVTFNYSHFEVALP